MNIRIPLYDAAATAVFWRHRPRRCCNLPRRAVLLPEARRAAMTSLVLCLPFSFFLVRDRGSSGQGRLPGSMSVRVRAQLDESAISFLTKLVSDLD
jgi:hypothetical protein